MSWVVIVSTCSNGRVRRRTFGTYSSAREYADKYRPPCRRYRRSNPIGFAVELYATTGTEALPHTRGTPILDRIIRGNRAVLSR